MSAHPTSEQLAQLRELASEPQCEEAATTCCTCKQNAATLALLNDYERLRAFLASELLPALEGCERIGPTCALGAGTVHVLLTQLRTLTTARARTRGE